MLITASYSFPTSTADTAPNDRAPPYSFLEIQDTTAPHPSSPTRRSSDLSPVTGNLTSGDRTNDTDLTVRVSLAGISRVAVGTVDIYICSIASCVAHILNDAVMTAGAVVLQIGMLSNGNDHELAATIIDID